MGRVVIILKQRGSAGRKSGAQTSCELGRTLAGENADKRVQKLLHLAIILQRSHDIDGVFARLANFDGGLQGPGRLEHL